MNMNNLTNIKISVKTENTFVSSGKEKKSIERLKTPNDPSPYIDGLSEDCKFSNLSQDIAGDKGYVNGDKNTVFDEKGFQAQNPLLDTKMPNFVSNLMIGKGFSILGVE